MSKWEWLISAVSLAVISNAWTTHHIRAPTTPRQDNVNPIARVEQSTLILASSVHRVPCRDMLNAPALARLELSSPVLFTEGDFDGE